MSSSRKYLSDLCAFFCAAWAICSGPALALDIGYGGRITESSGKPIEGPADLKLRFYSAVNDGDLLGPELTFPSTDLMDGVFQVNLSLSNDQTNQVFGDGSKPVFVEVEVKGKVYPRQRIIAVPFALRVPIDNSNLVYNADGRLTIDHVDSSQVSGLNAALSTKANMSDLAAASTLKASSVTSATIASGAIIDSNISSSAAIADSKLATINTPGKVLGSAITSGTIGGTTTIDSSGSIATTGNLIIKGTGSATTELHFNASNNNNYVGFKAPSPLASNYLWVLPNAYGVAGQYLGNDGAGNLSWSVPSGSGDMVRANNLSDVLDKKASRNNLGLGPNAVSANGQLLIGNGSDFAAATLAQGANAGVTITNGAGSITLDTTQDIRTSATPTFSGVNITTSLGAPTYVVGSSDNTGTPSGGTLRAASAAGTDKGGSSLTINAGNGTGTGGSGSIILQTAAAAGTSSTANIYKDWFRLTNAGSFIFGAGEGTATVSAATLRGPAAAGTDKVGASLTVAAGNGTGTGGSGSILFQTAPTAGSSSTANTLATAMSITPAGNVGVGNITPGSILDVNGAFTQRGMSAPGVSAAGQGMIYFDSTGNKFRVSQNNQAYADLLTGSVALASQASGTLPVGNGGTGTTTLTSNGMIFGNGTSAVTATAAGTQYQVLQAGAGGTPAFGALNLGQAAAITGTLPVGNGGTGLTSGTSGGVPYYSASGTLASSGALTSKGILLGGGAGAAPYSTAAMSNGQLLIGSTGVDPVLATLTVGTNAGVTISNSTGSITLDTTQDIRTSASPTFANLTGSTSIISPTQVAGSSDNSASPVGGTLRAASAAGTDKAGSNLTISAGNGTGTGGSGSLLFQIAPQGTTGSTVDTLTTALAITPNSNAIGGGNVGIGTTTPLAKLHVKGGQLTADQYVLASGATADFNNGNIQVIQTATGSALTLNNMVDGAAYTLIVADTTSRTYTFTNCTNSHFTPANAATTVGTQTVYTILKVTIAAATHCYISWVSNIL